MATKKGQEQQIDPKLLKQAETAQKELETMLKEGKKMKEKTDQLAKKVSG